MLRGENFSRRHQRGLVAVFDGHQHGLKRHDGLAGADVTLEEPAHWIGLAHVGYNLAQRALLCGGGMKGKHLADGFADAVVGGEGNAGPFAHAAALELEAEFEEEQLFEDETAVRGSGEALQLREWRAFQREMSFAERGFSPREIEALQNRKGKTLGNAAAERFEEVE